MTAISSELYFRWADREDAPLIRRFLADNFGPESIQAAPGRFESLFLDHPLGLHVTLCLTQGAIIGARFHLPVRIGHGNRTLNAAFPVDMMVEPRFRRMGIGKRFMEMALERFQATISTGQSPENRALYDKLGVPAAASFSKALLVRRPGIRGSLKATARDLIAWSLYVGKRRPVAGSQQIPPEQAAALAGSLPARLLPEEYGSLMDGEVFSWRYCGPFYDDYSIFLVEWGEERGMLVTRMSGDETRIIDIFCRSGAMEDLLLAAPDVLPGERITAVFSGRRPERAFRAAGFLVRPVDASLVVSSADPSLRDELYGGEWVMYGGDSDTDLRYFPDPGRHAPL